MTGYRVHFIDRVRKPMAFNSQGTMWIVISIDAKDTDHDITLFFESREAFEDAVFTLNAEIKESVL